MYSATQIVLPLQSSHVCFFLYTLYTGIHIYLTFFRELLFFVVVVVSVVFVFVVSYPSYVNGVCLSHCSSG